jgi:hypothetical protein
MRKHSGRLALLAVVALSSACGAGDSDGRRAEPEPEVETDTDQADPAVEQLPPTPMPEHRRVGEVVVPVGPDVVVLGGREIQEVGGDAIGSRGTRSGLIYRDETKGWSELEYPFSKSLYHPGVVSTGDRVIVVGTLCDKNIPDIEASSYCPGAPVEAAVYSPSNDEWRTVSPPPTLEGSRWPFQITGIGWTGTHAVFQFRRSDVAYGAYDLEEDRWTMLPAVDGDARNLCITRMEILGIGFPGASPGGVVGPGLGLFQAGSGTFRTARFTDSGEWEHLADTEVGTGTEPTTMFQCQGGEAIVARWAPPGALNPLVWFEPSSGTWSTLPSPPEPFTNATPARDGATRVLFTVGTKYWLLPDGASQWQGVPWDLCDEDTGLPDTCWPSPPQVLSHDDRLLLVVADNEGLAPIHITRLRPVQYAAEQAAAG